MSSQWKYDDTYTIEAGTGISSPERQFGLLFQEYVEKRRDPANHQQHTYPAFRTIFWDEPLHNPQLKNGNAHHMDVACESFERERKEYWKSKVPKWFPPPADYERMVPGAPKIESPRKSVKELMDLPRPKRDTFPVEKAEQYWGRERRINPYARAKVFTRPQDRHRPVTKEELRPRDSYVLPDEWARYSQPVCGVVRPSSFMASKTRREFPFKPAEGQDECYDPSISVIPGGQKPKSSATMRHLTSSSSPRVETVTTSSGIESSDEAIPMTGTRSNIPSRMRHHSASIPHTPLSTVHSSLAFTFGKSPKLPITDSLSRATSSMNTQRGTQGASRGTADIYIEASRHDQLMNLSAHDNFEGGTSLTLRLEDPVQQHMSHQYPHQNQSAQEAHSGAHYNAQPSVLSPHGSRASSPIINVPRLPSMEVPPSPVTRGQSIAIPIVSKLCSFNPVSRDSIDSEPGTTTDINLTTATRSSILLHTPAPQIDDYSHLDRASFQFASEDHYQSLKKNELSSAFHKGVEFDPNPTIRVLEYSKNKRRVGGEARPKTIGQKLKAQQQIAQSQSKDSFSQLLNRTRPHAIQLHKKVSMHVADVASVSPFNTSPKEEMSPENEAFGKNSLIHNDESTKRWIARSLDRKHLDGMGLKSIVDADVDQIMRASSSSSLAILHQLEEAANS